MGTQPRPQSNFKNSLGTRLSRYYLFLMMIYGIFKQRKKKPNLSFVYYYFCDGLLTWEANADMQLVFTQSKAVAYICAEAY